jgi:hypothetical protein
MTKPKVKRRIDVMPSSTTKDLPEHRQNVIDAIIRVGWHPLTMEYEVGKPDEEAISFSLRLVDESEVYILILGARYGYIPKEKNPKQISITQMEYERALERPNLKRLYFVMDLEKHPIMAGHLDKDESAREKMNAFREHITTNHMVSFFSSVAELRSQVIQALYELRLDMPVEEDEEEEKKSIPLPPELYAFPSYSDQNAPFVGRKAEIKQLNQWAYPESNKAMLILEAIGGMGKSALAWKWMQDRAVAFDGYFWYSFYEGGADMRECIRHALAYVSRRDPDEMKGLSLTKMLAELEAILKQKRYLLVLDGLERVLLAYHRWDAAQMQDDSVPEERDHRATTNPEDADILKRLAACSPSRILLTSRLMPIALEDTGSILDSVEPLQLRGLSPEDARRFWQDRGIKWDNEGRLDRFIGQFGRHSLLLKILAGEILKDRRAKGNFDDWYERNGEAIDLYDNLLAKRHHILEMAYKGLSEEARKILSQIAALGGAVDLDTLNIFNPYLPPRPIEVPKPEDFKLQLVRLRDTYSQSTRPLSKEVLDDYLEFIEEDEKEYREWFDKLDTLLDEINSEEASTLQTRWSFPRTQKELKSPEVKHAAYKAYKAYKEQLSTYETYLAAKMAYVKSLEYRRAVATFDTILQELEERGLLWWDKVTQQYDLHPVVRGYAFELLEDSNRPQTFDHIYNYFDIQERNLGPKHVRNLRDLQSTLAMYNALIGAKKFDAARQLFRERFSDVLIYSGLGLYRKAFELLLPFFPNGLTELPVLSDKSAQRDVLSWMGATLGYMNRIQDALEVDRLLLQLALEANDEFELGTALSNYSVSLRSDNQLVHSLRAREYGYELASLINNWRNDKIKVHYYLLTINKDFGRWKEVDEIYQTLSADIQPNRFSKFGGSTLSNWRSAITRTYIESLLFRGESLSNVLSAIEEAERLKVTVNNTLEKRMLIWLKGEAVLQTGDITEARNLFSEAIRIGNESGSPYSAAWGSLARAHLQAGDKQEALRIVKEEGTDNYSAAFIYWKTGHAEIAKEKAIKYYMWAWAQGEPYVYKYDLERVRALLKEMSVEEPQLPVWDESKYKPFAYEEEVKAFIEELKRKKEEAKKQELKQAAPLFRKWKKEDEEDIEEDDFDDFDDFEEDEIDDDEE